jgi:putative membrane protein
MMIYRGKNDLTDALLAAFIGTAAMTVAMLLMHRALPRYQQKPLPPYHISMHVAERVGLRKRMDEDQRFATTMLLHFGYGTIVGSLYAPFQRIVSGASIFKGMLFGVIVWGGSYLGWLPATGLLSSAKHHAASRNALMIAAHLVWGTTTAILLEKGAMRAFRKTRSLT